MPKGKAEAKGAIEARTWSRTAAGNVKALFTITPAQDKALREEAFKRATAAGSRKPDASAVLREVLDAWLAKRAR
jgi:hypothetical protein